MRRQSVVASCAVAGPQACTGAISDAPLLPSTPVSSKHTKAVAASKKGSGKGRGALAHKSAPSPLVKRKKERKKLPSFVRGLKERHGTVAAVAPAQDI
ncbi:uncharacterized [Tachysurus ichikawai]